MTSEEAKTAFMRGYPVIYDGVRYIMDAIIYKRIGAEVVVCGRLVHIGKESNYVIEAKISDIQMKGI